MKNLIVVFVLTVSVLSCKNQQQKKEEHNHQETQTQQEDVHKKKPLSPHTSTMEMIGDAHIHIDYSSPGVRERIIFGGLVGYDQVWQAGAHMATWIETSKDLIVHGELLPKGKYGFFTIPSKNAWTVMINKNWNQHGKDDYDENDDVIRFKVRPSISDEIKEHLEYKLNRINETEGSISLAWEKVTISFPIKINQ